jgi:DNA-binding NarL/FixJ family response regulator
MAKSILIVDDSDTSRMVSRFFLETQADLEICGEAVDGLEGIEKAKALHPDLVLLDLALPYMTGVEAASIIRRMMPGVRIVMFTLYSDDLEKALTSIAGVDAVLSKPDGGWKLIECVRNLLQAA